ncbi:zinc-binding alcohol dehydrogenase [Hyphomicrobium sp.]|jgi:2-desacetyl-2-hydroxyethyl bacteriochlorophyllide A dehydrogenase|uniref:zinc-dependent alcohol dehydrogenase n=1 Tax=Hyphomicrobium sp. TaxID=82 RepID=UPI002BA7A35E|nr:zinc-binding alcohol dehydrogenase [Hyphomicrobium sp.]HVZ03767.1 zinc-binding alcohol dehydrogenase [Hyphomicrobium sp.]
MNDQRSTLDHNPRQTRRSQGQIVVARGLWHARPGHAEFRTERLPPLAPGEARVATEYSAISRGTERLVALGQVPKEEWQRMRAPHQSGTFSFPVKYGYSAAGVVTAGREKWIGRRVFALHPHQDYFQVSESDLIELPDTVPTRRAVLAANMETALNAHWDAGTGPSDRILVVGAGVLGLLVAYLARRIAGTDVTIVDIDPSRAELAAALDVNFSGPDDIGDDYHIAFHATATSEGLQTAIDACAFEGRVVELSWYGTTPVTVKLGGAFHSRRLQIVSSQVGHVAPSRRSHIGHRDRLERAIGLLDDPALDTLVARSIPFDELPEALSSIWSSAALPPVVCYRSE